MPEAEPDSGPQRREYTIHELARETDTTVRNIRAYRNRKLLPAPERRGRNGVYTQLHAGRLRMINELLARGYTIANIEELLRAWLARQDLDSVLGIEAGLFEPLHAEAEARYTYSDLKAMFGKQLTPTLISMAVALELMHIEGEHFVAPRPKMLEIGALFAKNGFPVIELIEVVKNLRGQLQNAASTIIRIVDEELYSDYNTAITEAETKSLENTIWQMRKLVDEALLSEMSWVVGRAIRQQFGERLERFAGAGAQPEGATESADHKQDQGS